jgi:large subunit ribosomal protein L4
MSKLTVYDLSGASVGDLEVADGLLEKEKGAQAVHDVVVAQRANRRAGTASTLTKGEVTGTGSKPWRQKGTGRARAGYRQSPVWRGGAVAFGPRPRDYSKKVNRKVEKLAFRRALTEKLEAGQVKVVDSLAIGEPKTRAFAAVMKSLGIAAPALVVTNEPDRNLALAARNIPGVEVALSKDVNVYQLLRYPTVVVSRSGMEHLTVRLGGAEGGS